MYHAMFPPQMVVHLVGQQQQQQQYNYSDASNGGNSRQNRIIPGNNYGHGPFEQPYPLELLQLMGFDMPPIRSRAYNHPPAGRGGGGWRERGNVHASGNPLMPPPVHVGFRPLVHNNAMKRNYWNKNNGRPMRNSEREGGSEINHSSSSDSGFSSRSPTPNKQQGKELSAGDMSGGENEELDVSNSSTSSADNNKGLKHFRQVRGFQEHNGKGDGHHQNHHSRNRYNGNNKFKPVVCHRRLHEVYGTQGQNGIGGTHHGQQHQQQYYHQQHSSQHSMQALHNLQYYQQQQQQQSLQHGLVRSESPYQTKRRYHSGRHSPPLAAIPPHLQRHPRGGRRLNGMLLGFSSGLGPPYTIAPDRFLSHAHLMQVTETPLQLLNGSDWDKLSEGIWNKFMANQQTEETYRKKMHLWKCLYIYIKTSFPRYGLYLVGSTMNGFGSDNSDVDMCLLVRHSEMDQRNEAVGHLEQLLKYLRHCEFIEHPELIQAKVPILKFRDTHHCLEVDLNCNNAVGIRNTHLLYCYSQLDWRVRPLVLIVKLWAHKHNINDAKNMTISSYSLVLMVIHFLQCGVSPPVLPCLHHVYQGKFTPHSDIQSIDIHEDLRPFKSENTQSLGELLYEYLRYYVEFDFSQYAISVRLASRIPIDECRRARSYKNDPHQWKYLCIEEPFDLTNTARSVYDRDVFEKVKAVFHKSYNSLKKNRDIESIFNLDKRD